MSRVVTSTSTFDGVSPSKATYPQSLRKLAAESVLTPVRVVVASSRFMTTSTTKRRSTYAGCGYLWLAHSTRAVGRGQDASASRDRSSVERTSALRTLSPLHAI